MANQDSLNNGDWLCPDGPYRDLIKTLITADPRLKHRDAKAVVQGTPWPSSKLRVVNLQLQANKSFQQTAEWSDLGKFRLHLETTAGSVTSQRNIVLVEGLSPDLIETLGTQFDIHPSFFVDHERVVVFTVDPTKSSDSTLLPSCINWNAGAKGLTIKYFEPMEFSPCPPGFRLSCMDSGRHIGVFRLGGKISSAVVTRRKCSIWPVSYTGSGYTCIILCDPPLRVVSTKGDSGTLERRILPVRTTPYQGGYLDFMIGQDVKKGTINGPPRSSMLDDLRYYLTEHGSKLPDLNDPKCTAVFVEKIVASQYLSLSSFMSAVLSRQQWSLSRQEDMVKFGLSMVEQQWSDIQSWERRMNEYCNDIEELMVKLGVPFQDPDPSSIQVTTWFKINTDLQFLRIRFQCLRNRAEQISAATSGLASIAGNRQAHRAQQLSLRETQRTKALTLFGLVFIPLAYTATLLSMNEQYLPGATHFWVYFSVSLPLILAVIAVYLILDKMYGNSQFTVEKIPETSRSLSPGTIVGNDKTVFDIPQLMLGV